MKEFNYHAHKLGTEVDITVVTDSQAAADRLAGKGLMLIDEYEKRFSRFLPDSELSELNASGEATVSDQFMEVLNRACELSHATNGIYNPLFQIKQLGYDRDFSEVQDSDSNSVWYNIDLSQLTVNRETNTVRLAKGQQLDFGGFLKGYMAQQISKTLMSLESAPQGLIINLGGDICTVGVDENGDAFTFTIDNPISNKSEEVTVQNACIATSGTYKRTWLCGGRTVNHILSAVNKNPDTELVSASVIHEDGALAEGYAKTFLCTPYQEALNITGDPALRYLLISKTGSVTRSV